MITLLPTITFVIKCVFSGAIDIVFMTRDRQILAKCIRYICFIFLCWGTFLIESYAWPPLTLMGKTILPGIVAELILLVVALVMLTCVSSSKRFWGKLKDRRYYHVYKVCFGITFAGMMGLSIIIENDYISVSPDITFWQRMIISFGLSVIAVAYVGLAFELVKMLFPINVWIYGPERQKRYLLHAFDKKSILCCEKTGDKNKCYIRISKDDLLNKKIYVGEE